MFKKITICLVFSLLLGTVWARDTGLVYHEIQVVDEIGRNVTDINDLYIYAPGGTTDAVIYSDRNLQNVITIPMTEDSTNTTLVDGYASWYGADGWDFSVTNGDAVGPLTNSGHLPRTSSDGTLVFPSYNIVTLPNDTGFLAYSAGGTTNLSGAGAIPITHSVVLWTIAGTVAGTLADGQSPGQILTVVCVAQSVGAGTLTPASVTGCGWATVIFASIGDSATFMYVDATIGWIITGTHGVTTNALLTQ